MNEIKNILDNYAWSEDGEYGDSKYTTDQALSDIRKVLTEKLEIDNKKVSEMIMFIRHNMFLPENDKLEKLKEMIITICQEAIERMCK